MRPAAQGGERVVNALRLPYPPYLWGVVVRSAVVWLLARLLVVLVLWLARVPAAAVHPSGSTHLLLAGVTAGLVWWDRRRSHELLLPANLGASPLWFWAASLLTAGALDAFVQALLSGR